MQPTTAQPVHTLLLPNTALPLLAPSASIAEVINVMEAHPVPFSPPWVLGVIGWRQRAVPVISFEALLGGAPQLPTPRSKIIVFFPLKGRKDTEFFALLTSSEPQPHTISSTEGMVAQPPHTEYVAAALKLGGLVAGIPNLDAMKAAFYP